MHKIPVNMIRWMGGLLVMAFLGIATQRVNPGGYNEYFSHSKCSSPLLEKAVLTATSSLKNCGPNYAKFNGKGSTAWSPVENTYNRFLIIDLGAKQMVRKIATMGRPTTSEFVTEYIVQYSEDGEFWQSYLDSTNEPQLFNGNTDSSGVHLNVFKFPIITQWIRVTPTRWHGKISLRVELFGCDYIADNLYFYGKGYVKYSLREKPIASPRELIRFRFKTTQSNGILMYSQGGWGDFIALQLRDAKVVLNMDLGSDYMTSLSVGNQLDDDLWHDLVMSRNGQDIFLSVDRAKVTGECERVYSVLNLNRNLYIGGVPTIQRGLMVTQNFSGCLENLFLNATNFIREMKAVYGFGLKTRYQRVKASYDCPALIYPVTFLTRTAYARLKGKEAQKSLNVSFYFRTHDSSGVMLYHKFGSGGFVKVFLESGKVKIDFKHGEILAFIWDAYDRKFNDGNWHSFALKIGQNKLLVNIDEWPMTKNENFEIMTGPVYNIAGGFDGNGFVGCMKWILIDGTYKRPNEWVPGEEVCCDKEVVVNACRMTDHCNPNPCEHGGECRQSSEEFFCDCTETGYTGAVCHMSKYLPSCSSWKNLHGRSYITKMFIDVDGSGPLEPFPVICHYYSNGTVITTFSHNQEQTMTVNGFPEPGLFEQHIMYEASMRQIEALVNRSHSCWQRLNYFCRGSRLLNSPSTSDAFHPFGWWLSRHSQPMDYWPGALPGSRKCECGMTGNCTDPTKWCNCDSGTMEWSEDGGFIRQKESLPVLAVLFGDTGTPFDKKEGRFILGQLHCEGDELVSNAITFRKTDATIQLPSFDMGHSGDIYLEFKTTKKAAVLIHATGPTDFIKLSLADGTKVQFKFRTGTVLLGVVVKANYFLNDNRWHSVSVERNRKKTHLIVDGALTAEVRDPGPIRALHITSELVIGATTRNRRGYVGCLRSLLLNGKMVDLKSFVTNSSKGINADCVGYCASSPCVNDGICYEGYDNFSCDCHSTAFKGPICADEIGVKLVSSSMIRYEFEDDFRSTIAEKIRVGFITTRPKGFLLGLSSNLTGEYLTMQVSPVGLLRCEFDFGFGRHVIVYPRKHLALGEYHDVRFSRQNGSTIALQVDNHRPMEYRFAVGPLIDARFNNIQYMHIGRNESMSDGFIGCMSRVQFDDVFPLKLMFQRVPPPNLKYLGSEVIEDSCGIGPYPFDEVDVESTCHEMVFGMLFVVISLILILIIVVLVAWRFCLQKMIAKKKEEVTYLAGISLN